MELKFIGTGASEGFPAIFCRCESCGMARKDRGRNLRRRSSALVNGRMLIDFPPDTYSATLAGDLDLLTVESVLITHSHGDHFYPPDLINTAPPTAFDNPLLPLDVAGNSKVTSVLAATGGRNGVPLIGTRLTTLKPYDTIQMAGMQVTALPANHADDQDAFAFLIEDGGKKVFYGTDSGPYQKETIAFLAGRSLDAAVFDCTAGKESSPFDQHMGLPEVVTVVEELRGNLALSADTRLFLTHIAHEFGSTHDVLVAAASRHGIEVAYDGLEINL